MKSQSGVSRDGLIQGLLADLEGVADHSIRRIFVGASLVAVEAARIGLCSNLAGRAPGAPLDLPEGPESLVGQSARETFRRLMRRKASPLAASLAMAAANALLPAPPTALETKAQDLILRYGRGARVAVAGHFPFVERMGESFLEFSVLEKSPRPGDLPLERAAEVFGRADLVALTAQTLVNGDLAGILALVRPGAKTILMGPSAPFASSLFAAGVDVIAGCEAFDPETALADVASGLPFKGLRGVRSLVWGK